MLGSRATTRKGAFPIGRRKTRFHSADSSMEVQDAPAMVFAGLTVAMVGAGMVAFGVAALMLDWGV